MLDSKRVIEVFNPTGRVTAVVDTPLPGLASIEGKIAGLLDNRKSNFYLFLDRLEVKLRDNYHLGGVIRRQKDFAGTSAGQEILDELAKNSDFVVTGSGD